MPQQINVFGEEGNEHLQRETLRHRLRDAALDECRPGLGQWLFVGNASVLGADVVIHQSGQLQGVFILSFDQGMRSEIRSLIQHFGIAGRA